MHVATFMIEKSPTSCLHKESRLHTGAGVSGMLIAVLLLAMIVPASSFLSLPHRAPQCVSPKRYAATPTSTKADSRLPKAQSVRPALHRLAARNEGGGSDLEEIENVFTAVREVEAGCVLVASPDEIDHFSRHAVVLVLSHGEQGSRGVTLEMATAFTVGEMVASLDDSSFGALPLFRGGSGGKDQVLMLHDVEGLARAQAVGEHGIYVGGLQSARDAVAQVCVLCEWRVCACALVFL